MKRTTTALCLFGLAAAAPAQAITIDGVFSDWTSAQLIGTDPAGARFWHTVWETGSVAQMNDAVRMARNRNAEYVYITDGDLPNPYGVLPGYWAEEVSKLGELCS